MSEAASQPALIFQQHRDDVYRWAYRLLGRHHDALDVAQDVFVKWLELSHRQAVPAASPRGWLRRVTINRSIDLLRTQKPVIDQPGELSTTTAAISSLENQELRTRILSALEQLTESQRDVLVAKVYDDLTFAQIAAEHGLAVPTVKTHYLRAVTAVRDRLKPLRS